MPPEIIKLIPHDDDLDKAQVQKAATPSDGRGDLPRAAQLLAQSRPSGVVWEKSSYDEADINAQRISALRSFTEKLRTDIPEAAGPSEGQSAGVGWTRRKVKAEGILGSALTAAQSAASAALPAAREPA